MKKEKKPIRKPILVRLLLDDYDKLSELAKNERRALSPYVEGLILKDIQEKKNERIKPC